MRGEFEREGFGQAHDAGLARRVGHAVRDGDVRHHGGKVDDAPTPLLQVRHEGAAEEEDARQVRVEYLMPLGERELGDGLADVDARVVDEDGRRAEAGEHRLPQLLHLRLARHVHLVNFRLGSALPADGLDFGEQRHVT